MIGRLRDLHDARRVRPEKTRRNDGQMLALFAVSFGIGFGIVAAAIDIGNIWNATLHVQRAAEAGALAGVPHMPGDFATATTRARAEATRNGFTNGGVTAVTPAVNAESNRRLDVTVARTYGTFFLRLFGISTVRLSKTATAEYTLPVPMGSPLSTYGDNSGNFWAVNGSQGADRSNGDAYGTFYNPNPTLNNQYDANGYQYAIEVPPGAGSTTIDLYDPTFCAVDPLKGTGDRWLPWDQSGWPSMSTYFTLWSDPADTPYDYSDDVQIADSGTTFEHERQVDKSLTYREDSASWPGDPFFALPACTTSAYHNAWWTLATVTSPGTYRMRVTTTDASDPNDQKPTSASNKWGLRAVSTDPVYKPYVYGMGKMAIYANVANGTTNFYLARVEAVHAGKTMVIQLFDPGDASGTASIQVLKPTTTGYTPSTFSYTADSNASCCTSGTNVTSLTTVSSGSTRYNNSWVTITIPLPSTYNAPLPPGEPAGTLGGWWKVRYTFNSTTTDTTTWQTSIRGNPVHLVLP